MKTRHGAGAVALTLSLAAGALAQGVPTSQPTLITIVREDVKLGHANDHARFEAGWPAAYARAKSTDYYLALVSMTGPAEAWYVTPYPTHAAIGESMKRESADPVLTAELDRLSKGDAAHINNVRAVQAVGRPDLSNGAFPDLALMRFFEVTTSRVRPGYEQGFEAAAKTYAAAAKKVAPNANWRVYEVIAGMAAPTYFVSSTVKTTRTSTPA
jgi:methenyltetrahydromethanopterin cyclohydrolase